MAETYSKMQQTKINNYIWDELNALDGFAHIRKLQDQQPNREFYILGGVVRNILIKKSHGYLPPITDFDVLVDDRNDKIFERHYDFHDKTIYDAARQEKLDNYNRQLNKLKPVLSTMKYDFFIISNHFMRIDYNTITDMKQYIDNLDFHMNSCIFSVKNKKLIATDECFNAVVRKDINMIWSGVNCGIELGGFLHNNLVGNYKLWGRMFMLEIKLDFTLNDEVLEKLNKPIDDTNPKLLKDTIDLKRMCYYIKDAGHGDKIDTIVSRFFNI